MQDAKEEVRARLAIEDVIGEYVPLKRAGRLWRGLSPFTNEKTPSFFVTPERNIWHDFSANRGGDIFTFIMEVEGLDFRGALELLARKSGVDLSQYDTSRSRDVADKKRRYLEANSIAGRYYQRAMLKSKSAQDYISKARGLSRETVAAWGIGYAPPKGGLVEFLLGKGFSNAEIRGAGLMSAGGNDMFRSRMMVPLCDSQGQIVGFTGRIIGDGEPKYINTPATLLYDKGRQVFGLHLAKQSIRAQDFVVLVEGNLDVISSWQAGVKNVVACAGTALTSDHLRTLSRLTYNIRFCFDSDKAGVAATERAIPLTESLDLKLSVISLPDDAKDPDELISKDAGAWQAAVTNHKPAAEWVIDQYASQVDLGSADGKKTLTTEAMKVITNLRDPVEREHYMKILADLTGTSMSALEQKLDSVDAKTDEKKPRRPVKTEKVAAASRRDEQYMLTRILAIALSQPKFRSILKNLPDIYLTEILARIKYHLLGEKSIEMSTDLADKLAELELIAEHELSQIDDPRVLMLSYMRELELSRMENQRVGLMNEFAAATADDAARRELINGAINGVNRTIKTLRETGAGDDWAGLFDVWNRRKDSDVL